MAPLLQRLRKGWGKQKDDGKQQGEDFPVKIRVVDADLSLRLSTTQEQLLKDLSSYVNKDDASAPGAGQAATTATATSTASPSANTAATAPASPLEGPDTSDTDDGPNNGTGSTDAAPPNTSIVSTNVPTNLVGNVSAITRRSEEETVDLNGNTKTKAVVPTTVAVQPAQPETHGARPRSLRDAFDSATDAKIFGDAEDLHGDPEFARRNSASGNSNHGPDSTTGSTSVGGFSPYGEINDTTTTTSVRKEKPSHASRTTPKKAPAASASSKTRRADVSIKQERDVVGSSYDDSYSCNESYEAEYEKLTLFEELIDFLCGDCAVRNHGGDRDSSAATGRRRRRRRSSSRRSDRRRPPRENGSRGRSSAPRSRRHK